jgi:hypothetical protein
MLTTLLALPAEELGRIQAEALNECSGLAASRRFADLVWACNDSGSEPLLYGLGLDGRLRRRVRIAGAMALDWEDLAAWTASDGSGCVLYADSGDNLAVRPALVLGAISESALAEADPAAEESVAPAWQCLLRLDEGAADIEAVAVDASSRTVLLLTKRLGANRFYAVPLAELVQGGLRRAAAVASVPTLPDHGQGRGNPGGQPTAMDLDAQGRLLVTTYGSLYCWQRTGTETWQEVLDRAPQRWTAPRLPQLEAACWLGDGRALLSSEGKAQPLLALSLSPTP